MTLQNLGLSVEDIDRLEPGATPFQDYDLGGRTDFDSLMEAQKNFYEELQIAYNEIRNRAIADAEVQATHKRKKSKDRKREDDINLADYPDL